MCRAAYTPRTDTVLPCARVTRQVHVYSVDTKGALLGRAARIKCGISLTIEQEKQQKDEEAKRNHDCCFSCSMVKLMPHLIRAARPSNAPLVLSTGVGARKDSSEPLICHDASNW